MKSAVTSSKMYRLYTDLVILSHGKMATSMSVIHSVKHNDLNLEEKCFQKLINIYIFASLLVFKK